MPYQIHRGLPNLTPSCRRKLINEGYKLLGFLHVGNAGAEDGVGDALVDQFAAIADGSIQGNARPYLITFMTTSCLQLLRMGEVHACAFCTILFENYSVDQGENGFPEQWCHAPIFKCFPEVI